MPKLCLRIFLSVLVINDQICSAELIATRKMRFAFYQTLSASHFFSYTSDKQPQVNHWNNVLDVWEVNNENNLHHDITALYHSDGANVNTLYHTVPNALLIPTFINRATVL
jgi:formate-dependent nitrite reductase cytochrome c552 subunit